MTLAEENAQLKAEIIDLKAQLAQALERLAKLEGQKEVPAFVRPNKSKPTEKKSRRKRASEHNQARKLETPTQIVPIRLERLIRNFSDSCTLRTTMQHSFLQ